MAEETRVLLGQYIEELRRIYGTHLKQPDNIENGILVV